MKLFAALLSAAFFSGPVAASLPHLILTDADFATTLAADTNARWIVRFTVSC